jgi:PIN domain nuclease of toxin-antitoxin system
LIHLDSHILIWAHAGRSKLTSTARRLLDREACLISPAVLLEIDGLFELRRIPDDASTIFTSVARALNVQILDTAFIDVIDAARTFAWTHDPFDRLIVANAMVEGARLLTADHQILDNFPGAVW